MILQRGRHHTEQVPSYRLWKPTKPKTTKPHTRKHLLQKSTNEGDHIEWQNKTRDAYTISVTRGDKRGRRYYIYHRIKSPPTSHCSCTTFRRHGTCRHLIRVLAELNPNDPIWKSINAVPTWDLTQLKEAMNNV